MATTAFLAELFGWYLIVIGCSFAFNRDSFVGGIVEMAQSRAMLLLAGLFASLGGLMLVISHNVWSGDALTIVVTLFGWAVLLKGLSILFLPQKIVALWTKTSNLKRMWYVYAVITFALGLYLVYAGMM